MIYLALAVFGLHFISLPIIFGATVYADSDRNVGKIKVALFGIPIYVKRIDIGRVLNGLSGKDGEQNEVDKDGQERENADKSQKKSGKFKLFLIDCARHIAMRVRVRAAELDAIVGTGDAAVSATVVGVMRIMYAQACAFFGFDGGSVSILPEYDSERIYFDFFGIFSLCFADIIVAVCATAINRLLRGTGKRSDKYANTVAE